MEEHAEKGAWFSSAVKGVRFKNVENSLRLRLRTKPSDVSPGGDGQREGWNLEKPSL